jgi:hypothetical protein
MDVVSKHPYTICATARFATSRSQGNTKAPASLSRGVCAESQAEAGRHGAGDREHRQAVRRRCRRAWGRRSRHGRLLRRESKAPLARHRADCVGETHGPGGGGVSAGVPSVWRRHPADRLQTAFRVRNHPWPSHSWQPPVAADFLSASRGRSERSSRTWANHSNRRRCRPPAARPPTHAELVQVHDERDIFQTSPDELPAIDIHSL